MEEWSYINNLSLNVNETKAVLFGPKYKQVHIYVNLFLGKCNIELVDNFISLGENFSENFTWDVHVEYLCIKLNCCRINKQA